MTTKESIMAQLYAAFGQGTGPIRVSRASMEALHNHYDRLVTQELIDQWDESGTHALERLRSVGRAVASRVSQSGRTVAEPSDVTESAKLVGDQSPTPLC
jgi:hypothetical protein